MVWRIEDFVASAPEQVPVPRQPSRGVTKRRAPFLKGPIPLAWLSKAASLRKPALPAGLCLWFQLGVSGQSRIRVSAGVRKKLGLSAGQMLRGLRALSQAGLVRFAKSGRGRCAVVEILDTEVPSKDGV